jgi:hypothetical protein
MPNQLENIASGAMGAAKAIQAKIEGLTGVFAHLAREHGEVSTMLQRVKVSSDLRVREEFFPKIRSELLAHERAEQIVVYPAFRARPELESFAEAHEVEAEQLEQQVALVTETEYEDPYWPPRFAALVDQVSEHVKEEEDTLFRAANRVIGREESEWMMARYQAVKADFTKGESR